MMLDVGIGDGGSNRVDATPEQMYSLLETYFEAVCKP
jgi:hypothetical protein